ncbi:phytanoyl-CoA dioxygenase family protein [Hymenobacter terricola]|uniref:hypothetical protein n=1 Tax=Hymenobacter terricola TaxID=2819236 RepID=UPI001B30861F|nr:hypothetical protein [Hymenobacter terricola]
MTPDSAATPAPFDHLNLNGQAVPYQVEGARGAADDSQVLLAADHDLTARAPWAAEGFAVLPGLPAPYHEALQTGLAALLREAMRTAGVPVADDFDIAQYHHAIGGDNGKHLAVIAQTKEFKHGQFPIPLEVMEAYLSAATGQPISAYNYHSDERVFHLRIVRPGRADHNPLHRDVWLPEYRDGLNIYLPVAGSTALSSLTLVPGSHHWPENAVERTAGGAIYHGVAYTVPGVLRPARSLDIIRPNPGPDEVLVFSPYLLHGAAANLNEDATRVSLEMRFWKA